MLLCMLSMYLSMMYLVVVTLLIQLLAKHSSAAYHVSDLVASVCPFINSYTTPHPNRWLRNYQMILLFNTRGETNHIDSKRPAPLSINELTTEDWSS